jgi:hypothetical protein
MSNILAGTVMTKQNTGSFDDKNILAGTVMKRIYYREL